MSKSIVRCFAALVFTAVCVPAFADVKLPEIFATNMVVQQEMPVSVWGWADADEEITASFDGQSVKTVTGKDGKWSLKLQALKANAKPQTFTVRGKNEIKLENVLIGEVWLCSGQSNMEWPMTHSAEYQEALKTVDNPKIRLFQVARALNASPQDSLSATWKMCNAENIPKFSAVGYYFGQKLAADLDVPVGLINSSWGGTRIEPWTTPEGFNSVLALKSISDDIAAHDVNSPAYRKLVEETLKKYRDWLETNEKLYLSTSAENTTRNAAQRARNLVTRRNNAAPTRSAVPLQRITPPPAFPLNPYSRNQDPTVLYNTMVNPFAGLAIRGAIWYQGESNNGEGALYAEKMKALINGWRKTFNPELGFYWVQIAPFDYGGQRKEQLPELQVAQSSVEKFYSYERVGQAVINDLVSNIKDIHPPKKLAVGNRLALLALNRTYGKKDVVCASPEFDKIKIENSTVALTFRSANELKTRDGKAPTWFEVAGADGIYHKADAVIEGTTIKLTSPDVPKPYAARFAWDQIAEPNVENEAGLPLGPFKAGEVPAPK
ncbi:hypothetical protein FACS189454_07080 [Planctomycetales bacterium]|nr:hypothetical protein FACS189454_07080 [Planctomycetales bacterium]